MKEWNSPAPTLGLAMTASCLFMWGQNWHMYTWASLGASLALVLGLGFLFLLLFGKLARVCGPPAPRWRTVLLWLLVGWLLVEVLMLLLNAPADQLAASLVSLGIKKTQYLKIPLALAVFAAICLARGFRLLNNVLLMFLFLSLGGGLFNIWSAPDVKIAEAGFGEKPTEAGPQVTLKKTPDIFLFFLESYHSPYAMRLIYGHDSGPMVEYLRGKNFQVYDQTLSNSGGTLTSMADVFTMRPSFHLARGNNDIAQVGRRMIGGSDDNHLYKILKDNGYHTTFLDGGDRYFFRDQGPNLDATDIYTGYNESQLFRNLLPLYDLKTRRFWHLAKWFLAAPGGFQGTLPERVRQAAERGQERGSPSLVCFFGGADHTPILYRGTQEELEAWKRVYLNRWVAKADREIKEIIEHLDEVAPGAIVILVGDHGARAYRGISGKQDIEEIRRQLTERNLTLDEFAQDNFGTLLAIRLPGGEQRDISYGLALNHVNLFRHVFAYLNDDQDILKTREEPSLSRSGDLILGRDNHPVLER